MRKKSRRLAAVLTFAPSLLPALALAGEDARVLPAGRSRMTFVYAQSAVVSQSYDNRGQVASITEPYHFDLSSANIAKLKPEIAELVHALNNSGWHYNEAARTTASHGLTRDSSFPALGDALSRGYLGIDAQATRQQMVAAYQYGITDRLSVGVLVPVMRTQVQVTNSLTGVNSAADAYAGFASPHGQSAQANNAMVDALNQIQSVNAETLQDVLVSRGYSRLENSHRVGLGDIVVGARYGYLNPTGAEGRWIQSVQAGVSLPTGRVHAASDLTEVDAGSGALELGLAHITNFRPASWWTLSGGLHYTYRVPNSRNLRVRSSPSDLLPDAASEERLAQRLGEKASATAGTTFAVTRWVTLDAGYEWAWKNIDRYQGARALDYSYLSDNTETYTETLTLGAGFSTLPAFLKKDFPLPASFSLSANFPMRGKNTYVAPYATAELSLYF